MLLGTALGPRSYCRRLGERANCQNYPWSQRHLSRNSFFPTPHPLPPSLPPPPGFSESPFTSVQLVLIRYCIEESILVLPQWFSARTVSLVRGKNPSNRSLRIEQDNDPYGHCKSDCVFCSLGEEKGFAMKQIVIVIIGFLLGLQRLVCYHYLYRRWIGDCELKPISVFYFQPCGNIVHGNPSRHRVNRMKSLSWKRHATDACALDAAWKTTLVTWGVSPTCSIW